MLQNIQANAAKHVQQMLQNIQTHAAKHVQKMLQNIQTHAAKHVQQMLQDIQTPQSNDAAMNAERHQQRNIKHAHCQPSMFKTLQSIPHSPHPTLGALQLPGALQHWLQVLCRTRTLQYLHRWSPCSPWNWFVPKTKLEAYMGGNHYLKHETNACYIFPPEVTSCVTSWSNQRFIEIYFNTLWYIVRMKPQFQQFCMTCWKKQPLPQIFIFFNSKIWQLVVLQYCQGGSFNKKLLGWNDPPKSITDCQQSAEDPTDGGCHCQSQLPATNRNSTQSVKTSSETNLV